METPKFGPALPGWTPPPRPEAAVMAGNHVRLEPLGVGHAGALFAAFSGHDALWDYLGYGPFPSETAYADWIAANTSGIDPHFLALCDPVSGQALGVAAWLRIAPEAGSIEVGHICLSPALQQTRAATEAMFLMMDRAFSWGYRRYEWKCDALNLPSRRAAARLGFTFEGTFRQAAVVKGRNRDTAWFAVIDADWPGLREAFRTWLSPGNFDTGGRQVRRLSDLTRPFVAGA